MSLWLGSIGLAVPEPSSNPDVPREDNLYRRIYAAYSEPFSKGTEPFLIPRARESANTSAATAVLQTLDLLPPAAQVVGFFDCRSSASVGGPAPTYELLSKCGLSGAIPVCLGGSGGAELIHAILHVATDPELSELTILSACQHVEWPDPRLVGTLRLGDGAGAVALTCTSNLLRDPLRIHGVAVSRGDGAVETAVARVLELGHRAPDEVEWILGTALNPALPGFPRARVHPQHKWNYVDFGTADVLISMSTTPSQERRGLGCIVVCGRLGGAGACLVEGCA